MSDTSTPNYKHPVRLRWLFKMAWRDSRSHRRRLLLYMSSIILGTASLVAMRTLGDNMQRAIDDEAKALLGADLDINTRGIFNDQVEAYLLSLGGDQSRQISFASMIFFPKNQSSRLIQVRALEGDFPYYGVLETIPPEAKKKFRTRQQALVDHNLMIQYDVDVGDSVRIGETLFEIGGRILKIPGETAAMSAIGPRVYIPMRHLVSTGLLQSGSRVTHRAFFKFKQDIDVEVMREDNRDSEAKYNLDWDTVEDRKRGLERSLGNLYRFLNLSGFIALILGSIGVASAIHTYIKQKMNIIAVLRCLGASALQTFLIYIIQAISLGILGAAIGVVLSFLILFIIPPLIQDFVPFELSVSLSWIPVVQGMGIGVLMSFLFSLLPLLSIRNISPLLTLRAYIEPPSSNFRDPLKIGVIFLLISGIALFGLSQTRTWQQGLGFSGGLLGAFILLTIVAKGMIHIVRRLFSSTWSYIWRQGIANLFRPNNQTVVLVVALGLGTFLVTTLYFLQNSIIGHITLSGSGQQSNMVLFDIQSDQKEAVKEVLNKYNLPLIQEVPVVSMRISGLKGRPLSAIYSDSTQRISRWSLRREYRSTYRSHLIDTEVLLQGDLQDRIKGDTPFIYVSMEAGVAKTLRVTMGDEIEFDVQGIPVKTIVGSIRSVDWQRVQPNFFVVFPEGVLEMAPQFHVLVTRIDDVTLSADFQREIVHTFPNVSMIDLSLILSTLNSILDKVTMIIKFMALFSVFTGLIVLIGVITNSRFQRIQESVLLKTLGGTRRQILRIMIIEYSLLGAIGALTGVLLAMIAAWVLTFFVFDITFIPEVTASLGVIGAIVLMTIIVGLLSSRGIHNRPPLEILRTET